MSYEEIKSYNHIIDELQKENAKLREQVTQLREERDLFRELCDLFTHPDRYVQVRAENAKLREVLENCVILLTDHQFLHLPELRDETFKAMWELGIEMDKDALMNI